MSYLQSAPTYDNVKAPPGYIPGRGRGATGFQTRSDIGNASGPAGAAPTVSEGGQFDSFSGFNQQSKGGTYDKEDDDADKIYDEIDERMKARREKKRKREEMDQSAKAKNKKEEEGDITAAVNISDQFADLKSKLKEVSTAEWEAIPDVGDYSLKYKQKRREEIFTPLPDNVLASAASASESSKVDESASVGTASTLSGLASSRGKLMSMNLDKMSDSVSGQTVIDPKGYLTSLASEKISTAAEIGDIKKARLLLKSVRDTNPKHGPGWIAAARVEEHAGKKVIARKIIRDGCAACPDSEDVWVEGVRLQESPQASRTLVKEALLKLPHSVKLWLTATDLETGELERKKVLRKALESVPNSVKLWKAAIEMEDVDDARIMLGRAVECCPKSVDMWLAYARLETYKNAKAVLNNARKNLPAELAIWIAAAKLEESQNNLSTVDKVVSKAVQLLTLGRNIIVKRSQWLTEAEACERAGAPHTCGSIVRHCIGFNVDVEDRLRVWCGDAKQAMDRGMFIAARAIYSYTLKEFSTKRSVWLQAIELEKMHGTQEELFSVLRMAVTSVPHAEILWLMFAKEKWISGDIANAREILTEAFKANPNSEQVWLAAAKLEWENDELARARALYKRAREQSPTAKVWMKSALLERESGNFQHALSLLSEGRKKYPNFAKFYLMGFQICESTGDEEKLKDWFNQGTIFCPTCVDLFIIAAKYEESKKFTAKARSILEVARLKNGESEVLWLESVRLERRIENEKGATMLMAKALQKFPCSGILWAEDIRTSPRADQKRKSKDAIKNCNDDPHVILAVARLFEIENKIDKARKWLSRAVALDPELGDAWAYAYFFERQHGDEGKALDVARAAEKAEPRKGQLWNQYAKLTENRRKSITEKLKIVTDSLL